MKYNETSDQRLMEMPKHESTNEPVAFMCQGCFYELDDVDEFCDKEHVYLYTHPQDQKKDEALRLALEAIKKLVFLAEHEGWEGFDKQYEAITLIEQALENK